MRIVLDTNVVVSIYLAARGGTIADLLDAWQNGAFDLVVSQPILDEYRRVLNYPHLSRMHGRGADQIDADLARIQRTSLVVREWQPMVVIERDPSDDKFLECAIAGEAEVIVSGDDHLLALNDFRGIRILRPAAFVELLAQQT